MWSTSTTILAGNWLPKNAIRGASTHSLLDSSAYLYCREAQFDHPRVLATLVTPEGEHHSRSTLLGRFQPEQYIGSSLPLAGSGLRTVLEILKVLPKLEGPVVF